MAIAPLPDDPGVLAGPARDLPGPEGNAVAVSDVDPRHVVEVGVVAEEDGGPLPLRQTRERDTKLSIVLRVAVRRNGSS